jgi:hypothetical protein
MATIQQITVELGKMALLYRQQMSPEELRLLVESWEEICRDLPDGDFIDACKAHLRESKFFPCPADIVRAYEDSVSRYQPLEIPPITGSAEEEHRAEVCARMCVLGLDNPAIRKFFKIAGWKDRLVFARLILGDKYPEPGEREYSRSAVNIGSLLAQENGVKQ